MTPPNSPVLDPQSGSGPSRHGTAATVTRRRQDRGPQRELGEFPACHKYVAGSNTRYARRETGESPAFDGRPSQEATDEDRGARGNSPGATHRDRGPSLGAPWPPRSGLSVAGHSPISRWEYRRDLRAVGLVGVGKLPQLTLGASSSAPACHGRMSRHSAEPLAPPRRTRRAQREAGPSVGALAIPHVRPKSHPTLYFGQKSKVGGRGESNAWLR